MCPQATNLLRSSNRAALEFSKALFGLLQALESKSGGDCGALRETVKLARRESSLTYQALEDHLNEHYCDLRLTGERCQPNQAVPGSAKSISGPTDKSASAH
jgi:hypothetical protein